MAWTTGHTPTCGQPCDVCGDACDRSPDHPGGDHLCGLHSPR